MNYIIGEDRTQIKIESIDSYVNENNKVRLIDKIVDIDKYLPIKISFESIDAESYTKAKSFINSIMTQIRNYFRYTSNKEVYHFINNIYEKIKSRNEFNKFITDLVEFTEKKVVLIIDEVDKSCNNQLFLDFLGMLRSKYLLKNEGKEYNKLK